MNNANVISNFALVSGVEKEQLYKWQPIVNSACTFVKSRVVKQDLNDSDTKRLEMLCALYAFRLYSMCRDDEVSSFTAGDVHITSSGEGTQKADRLWREYAQNSQDLIGCENFLFGRVV